MAFSEQGGSVDHVAFAVRSMRAALDIYYVLFDYELIPAEQVNVESVWRLTLATAVATSGDKIAQEHGRQLAKSEDPRQLHDSTVSMLSGLLKRARVPTTARGATPDLQGHFLGADHPAEQLL